ncbi:dTDP-glucose 4,6-dehydratase [candidate division CSSED10-310 bacterium]|uniref:dTDP-glucose 4,6-dehydratase n=1 Tax=candidate division CSSED10-310 bacterium TaxID=2855610 RepID=A0ABV6YSI9_UNCC1
MVRLQTSFDYHNLLVTGGCGFIGTNFIRYLMEQQDFGGRIINLDKLTYAGNPHNLADLSVQFPKRYVFVRGDVAEVKVLARIFEEYEIDAVCHFAAESHVDRSIKKPDEFIRTNIVGTFQLLERSLKQKNFRRFHHISTDEVFGSLGQEGYFTEETPYHPRNPYSASKASSDHLVRAYHHTYGLPITISNCSNNYGPFQFPEKLIPLMILNGLEDKPLPVYGDGKYIRDWLYVTDHCHAIWLIMKQGLDGETYNIGGTSEKENIYIVHKICDLLDQVVGSTTIPSRRALIRFVEDRPGHDRRYAIDFSKIENTLNWSPQESIDSGLLKTVQWYIQNQDWVNQVRTGEYRTWIDQHYGQLE